MLLKEKKILDKESRASVDPDDVLAKIPMKKIDLKTEYNEAVQKYKREFTRWRAGIRPDIAKVRSIYSSIRTFIEQKKMLTLLNDLSNSKDYIYHHSIAVGILASAISKQMGFPKGQTYNLDLQVCLPIVEWLKLI